MTILVFRLLIIYLITVFSMQLMGKRQIGQLQLSELVSAIFISELATYPITNSDIPLAYGILPVITLLALEVLLSYFSIKIPLVKKLFDAKPAYLIKRGRIMQNELLKSRITLDELLSQLRQKGTPDPSKVFYAVLEPNGQLSVVPKTQETPPTRNDLSISIAEEGISHLVIEDGHINDTALQDTNKDIRWLEKILKAKGNCKMCDVFVMTVTDDGVVFIARKEQN